MADFFQSFQNRQWEPFAHLTLCNLRSSETAVKQLKTTYISKNVNLQLNVEPKRAFL